MSLSWKLRCQPIHLKGHPEAQFWLIDLRDISLVEAQEAMRFLDAETLKKAERFKFQEDRFRCLICHAFLRIHLGQLVGENPQDLSLLRTTHGKPYLKCNQVHFNLSHTKRFAFFGTHPSCPIGVDIEEGAPTLERDLFLRSWCAEEAYLKSIGTGLSDPRPSLNLIATSPDGVDSFQVGKVDIQVYNQSVPGCKLAVCVLSPEKG